MREPFSLIASAPTYLPFDDEVQTSPKEVKVLEHDLSALWPRSILDGVICVNCRSQSTLRVNAPILDTKTNRFRSWKYKATCVECRQKYMLVHAAKQQLHLL